jgi:hypothetical protein
MGRRYFWIAHAVEGLVDANRESARFGSAAGTPPALTAGGCGGWCGAWVVGWRAGVCAVDWLRDWCGVRDPVSRVWGSPGCV